MSISHQAVCRMILTVASVLMVGCYRQYPPARPSGVPSSAMWAGGLDGGGWVTCSEEEGGSDTNVCTIWDEEGRTRGPAQFRLKSVSRSAKRSELRYMYVTGQAIGLEGGLELVQISPKEAARQ